MTPPRRGERLLETAHAVLCDELLPALPDHQRHAARMVARAMAIAARELNLRAATPDDAEAARALCASIRAGRADGGAAALQVHAQLLAHTRERLAVSNPKALARDMGRGR